MELELEEPDRPADGPAGSEVRTGDGRARLVLAVVGVAALLGAALVVGRGGDAGSTTPTTPSTSTSTPATATTLPTPSTAPSPTVTPLPTVAPPVTAVPAAAGWFVWTFTDAGLVRVDLGTGATDLVTPVTGFGSFRPVGGDLVALPGGIGVATGSSQWFLPADGSVALPVSAVSGYLAPGRTADEVLVVQFLPEGARAAVWTVGDLPPTTYERVPVGSYPVGGADGALLLGAGAGGTYRWRPGEAPQRLTTDVPRGRAVGGRLPVQRCDDGLSCRQDLLDVVTGERRPLPPIAGPSALTVPSPVGGWTLEVEDRVSGPSLLARSVSGRTILLDRTFGGTTPVWSGDGAWVAWISDGAVQVWRAGTDARPEPLALDGGPPAGLLMTAGP